MDERIGFVIARYALFSSGPNMSVYVDLAHTRAAYSVIEYHRTSAVVLIVIAFVSHFGLANFFKMLLRVATFILVFCMRLFVAERPV